MVQDISTGAEDGLSIRGIIGYIITDGRSGIHSAILISFTLDFLMHNAALWKGRSRTHAHI